MYRKHGFVYGKKLFSQSFKKLFECNFCQTFNRLSLRLRSDSVESNLNVNNIKIAIIGSGPAGFYAAQHLLKDPRIKIDVYEKFPVPFGLVRFGVAPDHPDVKNVINSFTNTALNSRLSFIGNVSIGEDITLSDIRDNYNAVVLCYGASKDRLLNIEGENAPNVISARRFVGWYNGIPQDRDIMVNLNHETAVIIGHGNVALDCARILLTPPEEHLKNTDITQFSLDALKQSAIKTVYIIGRRGPLQVAFTIKEFRELTKIPNCNVIIDPKDCHSIDSKVISSLERPRRRITELIAKVAEGAFHTSGNSKKCIIRFLLSPIKITDKNGIKSILLESNKLEEGETLSKDARIVPTGQHEEIDCGLVLRSIGYQSISLDPSLPFDHRKGIVLTENGRVLGMNDLYCSGWASGASGVILNTMNASFEVARIILEDINTNKLKLSDKPGGDFILEKLKSKNIPVVNFIDWQRIDKMEQQQGATHGKPREKIVDIKKMIEVAKSDT